MIKKEDKPKNHIQSTLEVDLYSVLIKNLILDAKIGIHSFEKDSKQAIRINLTIDIIPPKKFSDSSLNNVVDYEKIVNGIKSLVIEEHTNLVEVLAQKIANLCLGYKKAQSVTISIEKLEIIEETESVGIKVKYKKPI